MRRLNNPPHINKEMPVRGEQKKRKRRFNFYALYSTGNGTRTRTTSWPRRFKHLVYTNSTIPAFNFITYIRFSGFLRRNIFTYLFPFFHI